MSKKLALILGCTLLGSLLSFNSQAFPTSSAPAQVATPNVMLVRGLCGLGFRRGPYGYCVRNGTPYVYAPPVVVAPPAVVVAPRVCPYGYHLGPYGRCYPY